MTEQPTGELQTAPKKEDDWWEAFWRQDRLDTAGWGLAFIWGALVLMAEITGFATGIAWWDGWAVFFTGAGVLAIVEAVFRLQMPAYRHKWGANMIWGLCLLAIGFGIAGWQGFDWLWVMVLAVIGIVILRSAFAKN